jgi:transcriptional regulator with XRE-family HTH domain
MIPFDANVLSERVATSRRARKLSQVKLSEMAKVSPASISQIENGLRTPSTPVLYRIACALSVSIDYLVGGPSQDEIDELMNKPFVDFCREFVKLSSTDQSIILCNMEFLKFLKTKETIT